MHLKGLVCAHHLFLHQAVARSILQALHSTLIRFVKNVITRSTSCCVPHTRVITEFIWIRHHFSEPPHCSLIMATHYSYLMYLESQEGKKDHSLVWVCWRYKLVDTLWGYLNLSKRMGNHTERSRVLLVTSGLCGATCLRSSFQHTVPLLLLFQNKVSQNSPWNINNNSIFIPKHIKYSCFDRRKGFRFLCVVFCVIVTVVYSDNPPTKPFLNNMSKKH